MPNPDAIADVPPALPRAATNQLPIVEPEMPGGEGPDLLRALLEEQQQTTAVERFADLHESGEAPAQARYYRSLLPATPPGPGQQYAFDVDLDRCSGCKACVVACHTMNGLDEGEAWRDVGLLAGGTSALPVVQHVTTACHHCLEPACMHACPVNAYEKDPETGIVRHLDDQCFGCQYCTLACPYDVPKYHHEKGIVRKCDMCSSRLSAGEAPACVQSCPNEAIRIQVVDTKQVAEDAEAAVFLPAAPDPQITFPTTTFRSQKAFPRNMLPADYFDVAPQHPHWPLVIMLVLTQLSVGAFVAGLVLPKVLPAATWTAMLPTHASSALLFGLLALAASTFHLGRPLYAPRAILGLRHSWMSREILMFGVFAATAMAYAALALLGNSAWTNWPTLMSGIAWLVAVSGVGGVFCSAMIYIFTQRACWNAQQTGVRFALTTLLLGIVAVWLSLLLTAWLRPGLVADVDLSKVGQATARLVIAAATLKLVWDAAVFRHLLQTRMTPLRRSAMLMTRELSSITLARFALGALGGVIMPCFLLHTLQTNTGPISAGVVVCVVMLFLATTLGEMLERYLFFATASAPRMPGGIR